mgnify:CR=1
MAVTLAGLPSVAAGTGGQTSNLFLLDNILAFRDLLKDTMPIFDDQIFLKSFAARIQAMGSERMVDTLNASFYTEQSIFTKATIAAVAADGTDTNACNITYTTGSVYQSNTTVGNSLYYSPGNVQEVIMKSNSKQRALIVAKTQPTGNNTGHIIQVKADGLTGAQIATAFPVASVISFVNATKSELQEFGIGDIELFDRYDLLFQKLPGFTPLMSNESNSRLNVRSMGSPYMMTQTVAKNLLKMQIRKALSLIIGTGDTMVAANGGNANEVEGIFSIFQNNGGSLVWTNGATGATVTGYLNTIGRYAQANQMGMNLDLNHGLELGLGFQNYLNSGGISAGNIYSVNQSDGVDRLLNFAYQAVVIPTGHRINLIAEPALGHPNITATGAVATNYYPNAGWIMPHMAGTPAYNKSLGSYGQTAGPVDVETLVFGQTQGAEMNQKVKILSVYRGPDITNTEAGEVKWTEQYTLRVAAVNRGMAISPV